MLSRKTTTPIVSSPRNRKGTEVTVSLAAWKPMACQSKFTGMQSIGDPSRGHCQCEESPSNMADSLLPGQIVDCRRLTWSSRQTRTITCSVQTPFLGVHRSPKGRVVQGFQSRSVNLAYPHGWVQQVAVRAVDGESPFGVFDGWRAIPIIPGVS